MLDSTHKPSDETHWVSCLRENLTSSSYGEGLETDRATAQAPRQSLNNPDGSHRTPPSSPSPSDSAPSSLDESSDVPFAGKLRHPHLLPPHRRGCRQPLIRWPPCHHCRLPHQFP